MRWLDIRDIAPYNPDYAVQVLVQWGYKEEEAEFFVQDTIQQLSQPKPLEQS